MKRQRQHAAAVRRNAVAVPFGRFLGTTASEYPANEVLVGRERERARMLDWLLTMGRRGAYLVTGFRGSGKTSFVQYCMRLHADDVYGRYSQSHVGSRLGDYAVLLFAIAAVAAIPFAAAQLLELCMPGLTVLATATEAKQGPPGVARSALLALFALLLLLVCLLPIRYAFRVFSIVHPKYSPRAALRDTRYVLVQLTLIMVAIAVALFGPFAEPAMGTAAFVAVLGWMHLITHAFSVARQPPTLLADPDEAGFDDVTSTRWTVVALWSIGAAVLLLIPYFISTAPNPDRASEHRQYFAALRQLYVTCAVLFFSLSTLLRFIDARRFRRAVPGYGAHQFRQADYPSLAWLPVAFVATPVALAHCAWALEVCLAGAVPFALGLLPRVNAVGTDSWLKFAPRPRLLIAFKGTLAVVFGAQLLVPALGIFMRALDVHGEKLFGPWPWSTIRTPLLSDFGQATISNAIYGGVTPFWWWIPLNVALVFALLRLEHSWIVSRHARARADNAVDPWRSDTPSGRSLPGDQDRHGHAYENLALARATTFWAIYDTWLPVLTVHVNLGFDDLKHARVVASMLEALRDAYFKRFISWRGGLRLLSRIGLGAFALLLALPFGNYLNVVMERARQGSAAATIAASSSEPTATTQPAAGHGGIGPATQATFWAVWRTPLVCIDDPNEHRPAILQYVFPYDMNQSCDAAVAATDKTGPTATANRIAFYTYHIVALVLLVLIGTALGRRFRLFYYSHLFRRLDAMARSLSSATQSTLDAASPTVSLPLLSLNLGRGGRKRDTPIQQPWQVEQAFLEILRDLQTDVVELPILGPVVSLPAPEITFIFDELDKVGVASDDPNVGSESAVARRNQLVRRLFADMKNLLSVAPARFIFVGGRDMHDEWLADRTARQPLLSNVFDAELYLPSLLTDSIRVDWTKEHMARGIAAYLNAQLVRARLLRKLHVGRVRRFLASSPDRSDRSFVQQPMEGIELSSTFTGALRAWDVFYAPSPTRNAAPLRREIDDGADPFELSTTGRFGWPDEFVQQLIGYFALRSRGNPKRLDAMLETFIRPVGQVFGQTKLRWSEMDCDHVLYFDYSDRCRIRLLAQIYGRLCDVLGTHAGHRDDKVVRSAFYVAEFLFKFHRRAFSWSSLERIDELVHVGRSPDLRELLIAMISSWSEAYLRPILNGMYGFRFRSEVAAEIRFLSRGSEEDMAALNFTLDESQALKAEYLRRLQELHDRDESSVEVHAALGELYDWDEEYEQARVHYRASAAALDEDASQRRRGVLPKTQILEGETDEATGFDRGETASARLLRRQLDLAVVKLRLLLQIGLTYERSRDYQSALLEYGNARTLAREIWFTMLDNYGRGTNEGAGSLADDDEWQRTRGSHRLYLMKHMHIVYQAVFACAWVAEKSPSGIDTGPSMIEEALWDLRQRLPFVRAENVLVSKGPADVVHGNFSLAMADLHHGAGNLYFLKGRDVGSSRPVDGYLIQAQYHYACALHEVRRSETNRAESAGAKFAGDSSRTIFQSDSWPQFVIRRPTAALLGLADVHLARLSLAQLLNGASAARAWRRRDEDQTSFNVWKVSSGGASPFSRWLGTWQGIKPRRPAGPRNKEDLRPSGSGRVVHLDATGSVSNNDCLEAYVALTNLAVGLLERGGHFEEAGQESLLLANTIDTVLWSAMLRHKIEGDGNPTGIGAVEGLFECAYEALKRSQECFNKADSGAAAVEVAPEGDPTRVFAHRQPGHWETITCSLGLIAQTLEQHTWSEALLALAKGSEGGSVPFADAYPDRRAELRARLIHALERRAYSVLNRLTVLRTLLLDLFLSSGATPSPESIDAADAVVDEVRALNEEYASPLHFTAFFYGTALGAYTLLRAPAEQGGADDGDRRRSIQREAQQALLRSQQMCNGRGAYYDAIANLYYLHDDYNDREMHVRHAWQMLGGALTSAFLTRFARDGQAAVTAPASRMRPKTIAGGASVAKPAELQFPK